MPHPARWKCRCGARLGEIRHGTLVLTNGVPIHDSAGGTLTVVCKRCGATKVAVTSEPNGERERKSA